VTLFELTKTLINIPSVTGLEGEIADFLCSYLKNQGFDLQEQEIEEERRNILATAGSRPRVILCTHMDTVPEYFAASEDADYIYGRGACDAKGIMASMIWAAQDLKKDGLTEVGILFVVGEETNSIGAKMANSLNIGSDFIIVGEPTENKLGIGHKGIITLKMTARGKAAHSAYPSSGESAIEKLLDSLQRIRTLDFGEDPVMGKAVLNIGTIEGGAAPNVVANHASAEVCIRSAHPSEQILNKVKAVVNQKVEIDILTQSEAQRLFTVPDLEHVVLPYGTDIPHLKNFGKPLLLGPGSFLVAHTENEKIEKRQLLEAVKIYENLVKKLLG
jgi:acetylornithine deacetylase